MKRQQRAILAKSKQSKPTDPEQVKQPQPPSSKQIKRQQAAILAKDEAAVLHHLQQLPSTAKTTAKKTGKKTQEISKIDEGLRLAENIWKRAIELTKPEAPKPKAAKVVPKPAMPEVIAPKPVEVVPPQSEEAVQLQQKVLFAKDGASNATTDAEMLVEQSERENEQTTDSVREEEGEQVTDLPAARKA